MPELAGGKYYNTSLAISAEGDIVGRHRKVHLFDIDVPGRITFRESDVLSGGGWATHRRRRRKRSAWRPWHGRRSSVGVPDTILQGDHRSSSSACRCLCPLAHAHAHTHPQIGVGICYDIRFPELSLLMRRRGADVLVFPGAFNMTTGPAHWELLQRARAVDSQCYVATVSPARNPESSYVRAVAACWCCCCPAAAAPAMC